MADFYATRGLRHNLNHRRAEALLDVQLKRIFDQLPNKLPGWEKDKDELFQTISTQGCPNEYFDFLGHGSFKEVYELHRSHNYIVKFCSQQNDTETEKALLEAAHAENVGFAFIPTYFVDFYGLTCGMPLMLEDYNGESDQDWDSESSTWVENKDWEGRYATALEIQPKLVYTASHDPKEESWSPLHDPAIDPNTGEVIPLDILKVTDIMSKRWIESFARYYGFDNLVRLADFIDKYHVSDLHKGNLGYIADEIGDLRPVIIDWFSWDKHSIEEIRAHD